jgi:hypothetical protein
MEIYISINGVLRNFIQKFEYHYINSFIDTEEEYEEINSFEYKIISPIRNDDLTKYFIFQSKEEFNNFCFIEFPLELFGHAGLSYSNVIFDINKLIYDNPNINFTVIGIDEFAKAKPSTLFFLSKNGFMGSNIKFIKSSDIYEEWQKCNIWISDNNEILNKCPNKKIPVKFNTIYNDHFSYKLEINRLTEINDICLKYLENNNTSISMNLLKFVEQITGMKILKKN